MTPPAKPTAVIVEDEELARRKLRDLIATDGLIELVGEAADGAAAIEMIDALRPDLVFLDIDIPGPSGLDVLGSIRHSPDVIFTTAFDHYAVPAFDLAAIDYLLKPFSPARFRMAVARALDARSGATRGPGAGETPAAARARELLDRSRPLRRLFVPDRDRIIPVPVESIRRFEGRDDYVAVHVGERTHLLRARLKDLEERLDSDDFIRVHRSHIINIDHVSEIRPYGRSRLLIVMKDAARVVASRARSARLRRIMGS